MGDSHVCSSCGIDLAGKQHVKVVFENWPVEEEVTVRSRTGREKTVKRKLTKEVITAFGMECLEKPEVWQGLDVFSEGTVTPENIRDFFDDLRWLGKNPLFMLNLQGFCLSSDFCKQFSGEQPCAHIRNPDSLCRWQEASCYVGHPGVYRIYNKTWKRATDGVHSIRAILQTLKGLWKGTPAMGSYSKTALAIYFGGYFLVMLFYPPLILAKVILHK